MDMLQLRLFISVAQTLSFTKTAQEFYVAQPTVSNQIKALEQSFGVKLLVRDSRKVILTPEGQELLGYANKLLTIQMEAENRLRNMAKGRKGHLRIAMLSSTSKLFSECLTGYSEAHPGVQVDVYKLEGVEMMKAISRRDFDIYFANRYMVPLNDSAEFIVTGSEQLCLYFHKRMADGIDLDDWGSLQKFRFVSVTEMDFGLSGQIKNICANRGIAPDVINYFNQADTLLLAVNSGIGIAILPPGLTYCYNLPNVEALPISGEDAVVKSILVWHEENRNTNLNVQDFLNIKPLQRFQ